MNCFIEEIYFSVELILQSLRTWIEIEENEARDQKQSDEAQKWPKS